MVKSWPFALVLLTGCFPPPLDETGKKCDATRPCSDGYSCVAQRCVPGDAGTIDAGRDAGHDAGTDGGTDGGPPDGGELDAGPPDAGPSNVLLNPDFEDLGPAGTVPNWKSGTGTAISNITSVKGISTSGDYSARLTAIDGGLRPSILQAPIKDTTAGEFWCARLSVRLAAAAGNASTLKVALYIRERSATNGTISESSTAGTLVNTQSFTVIEEQHFTLGAPSLDFRLQFLQDAKNGEAVYVDDARLRRSVDGTCIWK